MPNSLSAEKELSKKIRKYYAISEKREGRKVKMSKLCPLCESNSNIHCASQVELYSVISLGLHFWTVEDQFVRSRYFSSRFAAQSAEVYIGAQSLHTSSDDFVLVGEFDFGVG